MLQLQRFEAERAKALSQLEAAFHSGNRCDSCGEGRISEAEATLRKLEEVRRRRALQELWEAALSGDRHWLTRAISGAYRDGLGERAVRLSRRYLAAIDFASERRSKSRGLIVRAWREVQSQRVEEDAEEAAEEARAARVPELLPSPTRPVFGRVGLWTGPGGPDGRVGGSVTASPACRFQAKLVIEARLSV